MSSSERISKLSSASKLVSLLIVVGVLSVSAAFFVEADAAPGEGSRHRDVYMIFSTAARHPMVAFRSDSLGSMLGEASGAHFRLRRRWY